MTKLWRGAPLILASKSSSRRGLLAGAGIAFEVVDSFIDERAVEAPLCAAGAGGAEIARHLARAKALAVSAKQPDRLVVGADQTLSLEGQVFVKPPDRAAAAAQLAALSGHTHELRSALCVARANEVLFEAAPVARLAVRRLSQAFIEAYIAMVGDAVLASVGAYQIEGLGIHLFEKIEGDHSTILGLPLLPLLTYLRQEGSLLR
ncbi:Maf family protein [Methylocapsa polymorpha]|uniref:Nucleoside triphosphate pyrophosphatase n=1 Tax=Methylocapsa polymorpha TaxID=3080828 RepID=A0ABZ0HXS5_9HYPH|nr:Maf family protein [Methylocapsa sp. RX1]